MNSHAPIAEHTSRPVDLYVGVAFELVTAGQVRNAGLRLISHVDFDKGGFEWRYQSPIAPELEVIHGRATRAERPKTRALLEGVEVPWQDWDAIAEAVNALRARIRIASSEQARVIAGEISRAFAEQEAAR